MGKSDHVLIEVELQEWALARRDYKNGRLNYVRANFEDFRKFFGRIDGGIMNGKTAQEKYVCIQLGKYTHTNMW